MRIHAMLVLAALWPFAVVAQPQSPAVAFAAPSKKPSPGAHKPHFKLEFVLRRGSEKPYDLSAFDPDTAVSAITAQPNLDHSNGHSIPLAPAAAGPNVLVCFGRECETPRH